MKLILINGQRATGKSSSAFLLGRQLLSSAVIDIDSIVCVNPWDFDTTFGLSVKNTISLIKNFTDSGYENIIISCLTLNQEKLDTFLKEFDQSIDVVFVWLRASKEERIARMKTRNRDEADKLEYFESVDKKIPDIESINVPGKYIAIDTSLKTLQEVVDEIKSRI